MRSIITYILLLTGVTFVLLSCEKVGDLPHYGTGTAPVLTASASSIAPAVTDSNNNVLTLSWSNPHYATDTNNVKYTIEIDSTGKNFANPSRFVVQGSYSKTFQAKELNSVLVGNGYAFNVPVSMDVRVVSSYANNNERLYSNVVNLRMTPYKVPPKVAPPTSNTLFLVGSASAGGWGNPVPSPAYKFTRLDSVTYEGTFFLNGGGEYLLLPVNNGDWTHKYSVADKTVAGLNAGGTFGADLSDNIPGPAKTGIYKIRVDFQTGKFTVSPQKFYDLLYVPGDYQGWTPATAATLGSATADGKYEGYINFPSGGTYEFKLAAQPDWSGTVYGTGGAGAISTSGDNLRVPGAGFYQIKVNTTDNTWSATKTTWGMIGDFNGWGGDADMTYDANSKAWVGTINVPSNGSFKFRANHDWNLNYGDKGADGSLEEGGDNINITPGTHTVSLFLHNAGYYTYKIQ
jgi:starch-binding outer membrane protein SusE/F